MRKGKEFKEKTQQIFNEIELALRWQSPILLFAVYRSSHVLDDAEAQLGLELVKLEQNLVSLRVRSDASNIVKSIASLDQKNKVFSIAGLGQVGNVEQADVYQSLNLHREYFIEKRIRSIFWITEKESQELSLAAPDFWAFRHRVIDFVSERATPQNSAIFDGLVWIEWPWSVFEGHVESALKYRKELLAELSDDLETVLMRIDLYAEMAGLYVQNEDWAKALDAIQSGIDCLSPISEPELEARLYIGLAIILIQAEHYAQAHAVLQKAKLLSPSILGVSTLLAQVNRLEGRRSEALALIKNEIRLRPQNAAAWNEYGNIYADLGRNVEALDFYQKAYDFSPEIVVPLLNKSAVFASLNRLDDVRSLIDTLPAKETTILKSLVKKRGFEFFEEII